MKQILLISAIAVIIIAFIFIMFNYNNYINIQDINNSSNITVTLLTNSSIVVESTPVIPQNDYVVNNINWTSYPNLETGYILTCYLAGPNSVINHTFIEVQINTEVKNTDNKTEILKQLDGVAHEARRIYGPNSGINIYGTKGGVAFYYSSMLPYDEHIY